MNAKELTAEVAALTAKYNALEQRCTNFAARMQHVTKVYRAEISALREQVAALTPKAPVSDRLSSKDFAAALAELKRLTGVGFHSPSAVRGMWLKMQQELAEDKAYDEAVVEDEMTL